MRRLSPTAWALGLAGLLPQAAIVAVLLILPNPTDPLAAGLLTAASLIYPAIILSFLGGIWWGFAVGRRADQAVLAIIAVVPSLVSAAILIGSVLLSTRWGLVMLAVAIILTLPVDRSLERAGDAPSGWLRFRAVLSLGLGGLTLAAALIPAAR